MKRETLAKYCLIVIAGLFFYGSDAYGINLVENGGFENDLLGWSSIVSYVSISSNAHSGLKALRIDGENYAVPFNSENMAVAGGETYKLSSYVKQTAGSGLYMVTLAWLQEDFSVIRYDNDWAGTNHPIEYTFHGGTFVAPENAVWCVIMLGVNPGVTAYFDDIELTEEDTPTGVSPGPVIILGPEEIVFDWTTDSCEMEDIPDAPARAFRDADGKVQLIATHFINRRMIGEDLASVKRDCNVIMASHMDTDPSKYNDKEWIQAVYTLDGVNIHALVHNEYQGHTHPGMCSDGDYFTCWYNSITYASSTDKGQTYTHAPAPEHRVANVPYKYVDGDGPYGIFDGSNIIRNPKDGYYYRLLHLEAYGMQDWGTGIMRTQTPENPESWRCWDGDGFNATFIDPYTEENYDPADYICEPVSRDNIEKMHSSLTYNTYFNKFLLVGATGLYDPDVGEVVHGFYYSLSDDLINWSPRQLIIKCKQWWTPSIAGDSYGYPSLIDPDDDSINFEYTDKKAYLYYSRLHIGTMYDKDLLRIPIEFTIKDSAFSAVPTSGKPPLKVQFYDRSIGDITSWSWNFGDGFTSTEQSPIHTYENIGTYTVSLSVWWSGGSDIETKNNYIKVKEFITMPAIPLLLLDD